MGFNFDGPSDQKIDRLIKGLKKEARDTARNILVTTAAGAVNIVSTAYEKLIYNKPSGPFGRPKDSGKPLAQAVSFEETEAGAVVFTARKEAPYLEFGTGIYNTIGARKLITPKRAKRLAYPFWKLPNDFKGFALYRKDLKSANLPPGAKGLIIAKSVKGIRPVPVWFNPATLKAVERLLEVQIKAFVND